MYDSFHFYYIPSPEIIKSGLELTEYSNVLWCFFITFSTPSVQKHSLGLLKERKDSIHAETSLSRVIATCPSGELTIVV